MSDSNMRMKYKRSPSELCEEMSFIKCHDSSVSVLIITLARRREELS